MILGNKTIPPNNPPLRNSGSRSFPCRWRPDPQPVIGGFPGAGMNRLCQDRRTPAIHLFRQCTEKDTSGDSKYFKRHSGGPRERLEGSQTAVVCARRLHAPVRCCQALSSQELQRARWRWSPPPAPSEQWGGVIHRQMDTIPKKVAHLGGKWRRPRCIMGRTPITKGLVGHCPGGPQTMCSSRLSPGSPGSCGSDPSRSIPFITMIWF